MEPIAACLRTADGAVRTDLPPDAIPKSADDASSLLWVDVDTSAGRDATEHVLRDAFKFHHLTIDDCYNTLVDPPKVDDYSAYLFVIVHHVSYDEESQQLATRELDLYIGHNYVVTAHRGPVRALTDVRRLIGQGAPVMERGAGFLAHALIDVVVDDFHPVVERMDELLSAIEEEVLENPQRNTLERLLALKRHTQRLRRTITPQRDVVARFARLEYPHLIPDAAVMYFRDIYDHTVRVEEAIDSVRDLADSALNTYLSSVNNRTNEVMKTLAIVAVIFLPLTLIAGIYGTNFQNVWEYQQGRAGYIGMWVLMLVVAGGLVAWFRYRRWF